MNNIIEKTISELNEISTSFPTSTKKDILLKILNIKNDLEIFNDIKNEEDSKTENIINLTKRFNKLEREENKEEEEEENIIDINDLSAENELLRVKSKKHINLEIVMNSMIKNYKQIDKELLNIYEFYFKQVIRKNNKVEITQNGDFVLDDLFSKKMLKFLEVELLKTDNENLKKERIKYYNFFKKQIENAAVEEINDFISKEKIDKWEIINKLNDKIKNIGRIEFVNYMFEEKYLSKLNEIKNKTFYYELLEEYEKIKEENDLNIKFDLMSNLKSTWINEILLKNKLLDIRKDLTYLKNIYKQEWISSIDLEYKENEISEIGITLKNIKTKKLIVEHYIIEDFIYNKKKYEKFNFGISEVLPLKEALNRVKFLMDKTNVITGNSISTDIDLLKDKGLNLKDKFIFDLNTFNSYFHKSLTTTIYKNLSDFTYMLGIEGKNFHNAGNDSYYSVRCFYRLMEKYQNMDFEFPEKFENLSEEEIDKDKTKDNIKRKIVIIKKEIRKNDLNWKQIEKEKSKLLEYLNLSDISIFLKKQLKNKKEEINFISLFKETLNENIDYLNIKNINNELFMDINNYIIFLNHLIKKMDINASELENIEEILVLLLTKQSRSGKNKKTYELNDKFKIKFYNENNVFKTYESTLENYKKTSNEIVSQEEMQYQLKNLQDRSLNNVVKFKNIVKTLSNNEELKLKTFKELTDLLNSTITHFTFEEMPIDIYRNIIDNLFIKESKTSKIEKYELEDSKNKRMIDISNIKELFSSNKINLKILESFFIPENSKNKDLFKKVNYFYLKESKSIYFDIESFIYMIKVFAKEKFINLESIKDNTIDFIEKYSIKSENFHQDFQQSEINKNYIEDNILKAKIPMYTSEDARSLDIWVSI
jgi:hypothetical protein